VAHTHGGYAPARGKAQRVSADRALRVFIPCTGLGREQRGFEAFTRDCAAALRPDGRLAISVFGGGGAMQAGERSVPNLPRTSVAARAAASLFGRDPYFVEQATFAAGFLPALIGGAPDVVYFGDLNLGNACWHWRRLSGQRYKLLYYNGGPTTRPFTRCDFVQQVSPEHLASAIARGEPADRQALLPHGLDIAPVWLPADDAERWHIRTTLGVPPAGPLVLSVGALNASHKRMDYVIREMAGLPVPRPHLLLLGAETGETGALRELAASVLDAGGFTIRSVPRAVALSAYRAADVFVLASVIEGFGLAHVEALAAGLPCIANDTPTTAYIYGDLARRGDLRVPGALTPLLAAALSETPSPEIARARHGRAFGSFSWELLAPKYVELFQAVAAGRAPQFT
jgi:glycosyltransferase involved in cell wall biosynthesis